MKEKYTMLFVLMVAGLMCADVSADGLTFAIIAKSKADKNFVTVYNAATEEAKKFKDEILFLGSKEKAHFRTQNSAVLEALEKNVDGIAISVLNDKFLAENSFIKVSKENIPVVAYDSDFSKNYKSFRVGYIGTDNEAFGYNLGLIAKKLRPQGGIVAIMSGLPEANNLNQRMKGVRASLSGDKNFNLKLSGEGGWTEHQRTPWYNWDDYNRALQQLIHSLEDETIDVFISVGWHPQMAENYREKITPFKEAYFDTKKKIIICADNMPHQMEFLRDGLSHGNIGQNFAEMGRLCYRYLKKLSKGETIPEYTYTPVNVYLNEN